MLLKIVLPELKAKEKTIESWKPQRRCCLAVAFMFAQS